MSLRLLNPMRIGHLLLLCGFTYPCIADVLVGLNGERFVGKVLEESAESVVFESDTGGRLTVPRARVRALQRTLTVQQTTNLLASAAAQPGSWTNAPFLPPGLGKDGLDWLQLKSHEWLRGRFKYLQDKKVQFESDELEDQTFKLKDVRQLYPAKPMFTKFDGREQVFGTVFISNKVVEVIGPDQVKMSQDELQGITPGGKREIDFWSGNLNLGFNLQQGNTKQATINASGELARRTPATQLIFNYLGNFSEIDGTQSANNHRFNLSYDVRLSRTWFLRPLQAEYYRDQLANISHRITAGLGAGYYLIDTDDVDWWVAAGPAYQYTKFVTVSEGEDDTAKTPAATFQTRFKADLTKRWTFKQDISATVASEEAGLYSHHWVSTLEFEIKRYLDIDLSFVWDYLQNPQTEASGAVPLRSDLRLTLSIGAKF